VKRVVIFIYICLCVELTEYINVMERKRRRSEVLIYFADSGHREKEKIMKEEDRTFIRKRGMGNNCVRIMMIDLISPKSKSLGPIK